MNPRGSVRQFILTHRLVRQTIVGLSFFSLCATARAQQRPALNDGVYGRLSADSVLSAEAGAGVTVTPSATTVASPAASATVRFRALDSAGLFLFYQSSFTATRNDALGLGVDLRPLTLARIFQDWERGPRALDLFVDSIGLELGVSVLNVGGAWGVNSGLAWVFATGAELPLWWGASSALCLRGSVRWLHSHPSDAAVASAQASDSLTVAGLLVFRTMVNVGHLRAR
jgi:hypothetical protein